MSDEDSSPENLPGPSIPPDAISRELPIINKRGLHARASAKFVQMVERFEADVWVTKGSETVGGTSIIVSASGPQAQAALDAISELVAGKFNEEGT